MISREKNVPLVSQIQIRHFFTWLLIMWAYLIEHVKSQPVKVLFIPVMQVELSEKDTPGATIEDLKLSAKTDQDSVNSLYLKIGDKEYNFEDLRKYRTDTDGFDVDYADNGIFGIVEGGPTTAVADGYYIMTDPLQRGNYTVHYRSSLSCLEPGCAEPNFAQDIKYNIIAE